MAMLTSIIAVYGTTQIHTRFTRYQCIHKKLLFGAEFGPAASLVRTFENDVGKAITVNGERYRTMITDFFWPKLNDINVDDMWFQQDGATCHTADATINILHE